MPIKMGRSSAILEYRRAITIGRTLSALNGRVSRIWIYGGFNGTGDQISLRDLLLSEGGLK